jgi:hypothetical protein
MRQQKALFKNRQSKNVIKEYKKVAAQMFKKSVN